MASILVFYFPLSFLLLMNIVSFLYILMKLHYLSSDDVKKLNMHLVYKLRRSITNSTTSEGAHQR